METSPWRRGPEAVLFHERILTSQGSDLSLTALTDNKVEPKKVEEENTLTIKETPQLLSPAVYNQVENQMVQGRGRSKSTSSAPSAIERPLPQQTPKTKLSTAKKLNLGRFKILQRSSSSSLTEKEFLPTDLQKNGSPNQKKDSNPTNSINIEKLIKASENESNGKQFH